MPVWLAEGRCDLPDHRCIWDWIKYNLRAHAVQFSKRKAKEKKIRRTYCKMNLTKQSRRSNVILPIKMHAILIRRKKDWSIFMMKNFKVWLFAHGCDGVSTVKRVRNIFSIWRKRTMSKNMCENWRLMVRSLLIRSKFFLRKNVSYQELYTSKNLGNEQATEIFWIV